MKTKSPFCFSALLLPLLATTASAVTIASQTFDVDQEFARFGDATYANGISTNNSPPYAGEGIGFTAAGYLNQGSNETRSFQTSGGVFQAVHMSNVGTRLAFDLTDTNAPFSTTAFGLTFGAWLLFEEVDLTDYTNKTFSIDLSEIGTLDAEENFLVRLFINDEEAGTDIFRTSAADPGSLAHPNNFFAAGASFNAGTLTYSLADSVQSARLQIIMTLDDDGQGYRLDNVIFSGDPIPEPSSALLGGLGVLALLRRRRA